MESILPLAASYGYGAQFLVGILEFGGAPIAAVPVLLAAGAIGAMGTLNVPGMVVSVAAGGQIADLGMLSLARWRGDRIVDAACGLSANPMSCIETVQSKVARIGAPFIVLGKFIPGTAGLVAAAAGLAGFRPGRFAAIDAIALLLWASLWTGLGWMFESPIEAALEWLLANSNTTIAVVVVLVLGTVIARAVRVRMRRVAQAKTTMDGPEEPAAVEPA